MTGNPIATAIYVAIRLLFTIIRSIDVLIVVIVAAVLVGIGSAAGVIGLAFHNVGVLGKLYSEAIEGIDAGPLEAITATGANRFQVIWTAVIPQIVNPYISFTIYRLDTNVRLAPILGLVGGGGIGILLFQSINLLQYGAAGLIRHAQEGTLHRSAFGAFTGDHRDPACRFGNQGRQRRVLRPGA